MISIEQSNYISLIVNFDFHDIVEYTIENFILKSIDESINKMEIGN